MSAEEIIEEIKNLPPEQQRKVTAFAKTLEGSNAEPGSAIRPGFDTIAEGVFHRYDDLFRELAK